MLILLIIVYFSLIHRIHSSFVGETVNNIGETRVGSILPLMLSDEIENKGYVKIRRSTIEDAKYYTNFAGASYCSDHRIKRFNCEPYCVNAMKGTAETLPTKEFIVRGIYRDFISGSKMYLGFIPERKEIIISIAGERPQSNKVFIYTSLLLPLDVNQPGNNNTNIRTNAVAVHGLMHSIAFRMYITYKNAITELINEYDDYKVVVTGHSIGGSLASLTTIVLRQELGIPWTRLKLITYGQMRMGNKEFAKWINQQDMEVTRVVNYNDKTVLFIFRLLNFEHFGNELFIEKDGSGTFCDNKYLEDPNCTKINFDLILRAAHVQAWKTEFGIDC